MDKKEPINKKTEIRYNIEIRYHGKGMWYLYFPYGDVDSAKYQLKVAKSSTERDKFRLIRQETTIAEYLEDE